MCLVYFCVTSVNVLRPASHFCVILICFVDLFNYCNFVLIFKTIVQVLRCHGRICKSITACTRLLPRRPTALAFTKCGSYVIVADKAGDVHRFSVSGDSDASDPHTFSNSLLLGHVSMLMDLVCTICYILT